MFSPGSIAYQVFTTCLAECNAVMVYNEIMAEDVSPYAQKNNQLPVNVQPDLFSNKITSPEHNKIAHEILDWREETHGLVIGYAGSLRYNDVAFEPYLRQSRTAQYQLRPFYLGILLRNKWKY